MRVCSRVVQLVVLLFALNSFAFAQGAGLPDETCVASILNRTAVVNDDGSYIVRNIPAEEGLFRMRLACTEGGTEISYGSSPYFRVVENDLVIVRNFSFSLEQPAVPVSLEITSASLAPGETELVLSGAAASAQLLAELTLTDGSVVETTDEDDGTEWISSNENIATVSESGLVTAVTPGSIFVTARNEGAQGTLLVRVATPEDSDGDGLPDLFELAVGLDPLDPDDAGLDLDGDGLTNLEEYELGTAVDAFDTDGDGIADGEEVMLGTNPVLADSDGDGLEDADEFALGTNPLDADSDDDAIEDGAEIALGLDPTVADATTVVTGIVRDENGAPVSDASVSVFDLFQTATGSGGGFAIADVPAGLGDIVAEARRVFGTTVRIGSSDAVAPVSGGTTDVGIIVLTEADGVLAGTVFGPFGDVVPGASVTIRSAGETRSTNADATGFYSFSQLGSGFYDLSAVDPQTGLRGFVAGLFMPPSGSPVQDITLFPAGTIQGKVFERDGTTPVAAGVQVRLDGSSTIQQTLTDVFGEYRFEFVPLGEFKVRAGDIDFIQASGGSGSSGGSGGSVEVPQDFSAIGDVGSVDGVLTTTNQVLTRDVTFLGRGTVTGTVEDAGGMAVSGATVRLDSFSLVRGFGTTTTDGSGNFTLNDVFVGDFEISATDTTTATSAFTSNALFGDGDTVDITLTLTATGTLTGTVFRADGSAVDQGFVRVEPAGRIEQIDASGVYTFEYLPLGAYTLEVFGTSEGEATGSAQLNTAGQTVVQDLTLSGTASLDVLVVDAGGAPVAGVRVEHVIAEFEESRVLFTDETGHAIFEDLLAGDYELTATLTAFQLSGTASGDLASGEVASQTVTLEASGTIQGEVRAADGSLVEGMRVEVQNSDNSLLRTFTTLEDGAFSFPALPISGSPYTLRAVDSQGSERALAEGLTLTTHGEVITNDLDLLGIGTVKVLVFFPDGTAAVDTSVTLTSSVPGFSASAQQTDEEGFTEFLFVPEGTFTATAVDSATGFGASVAGTLPYDGAVVWQNVYLIADQVSADTSTIETYYDANNFKYQVQNTGELRFGHNNVFLGDSSIAGGGPGINQGGFRLAFVHDETLHRFVGDGAATLEEAGREVAISGDGPAGLQITRKVFVPSDGYFVRYLEVIHNPGASPVTLDVISETHYDYHIGFAPGGVETTRPILWLSSSGDGLLDVSGPLRDRWYVVDDDDIDPFQTTSFPAVAQVFDGTSAPVRADEASYEFFEGFPTLAELYATSSVRWNALTIDPSETIILLHFATQQSSRSAAQASAERLVELPPEAIADLTPAERLQVVNFDVPDTSSLASLPTLDGHVVGTVFESNGTTAVDDAKVVFASMVPYYSRNYQASTDASGNYELLSALAPSGNSITIPIGGFTAFAIHPTTAVLSPAVSGDTISGSSVVADITFGNTGSVSGVVSFPGGSVASSGTVEISAGALSLPLTTNIEVDGSYEFTGLPFGLYSLEATIPNSQGTALTALDVADLTGSGEITVDITLPDVGSVQGTVTRASGALAVNTLVQVIGSDFLRQTNTDSGGQYALLDIPPGSYQVRAIEPVTGLPTVVAITLSAGEALTQDITLTGAGSVIIDAETTAGDAVEGAIIELQEDAVGPLFVPRGTTDVAGALTIANVAVGDITVRATHPLNPLNIVTVNSSITTDGEQLTVPIDFPLDAAPSVSITAPLRGDTIQEGTTFTFTATATDDFGIDEVEFSIAGAVVGTDTSDPYSIQVTLPACDVDPNTTLSVIATDSGGNTDSDSIDITCSEDSPPTVSITAPTGGDNFFEGQDFTFSATATDTEGIAAVEFYVAGNLVLTDTTLPYSVITELPACPGGATTALEAIVIDSFGQSDSDSINVTCLDDLPPTVTIVDPMQDDIVIEGMTFDIEADVVDDVGVVSVEFFIDGFSVGVDTSSPYSVSPTLPFGNDGDIVTITATVTDVFAQTDTDTITIERQDDPFAPTTVTGVVVDELGDPVDGASILCLDGTGTTDIDGEFTVTGVASTAVEIYCTASITIGSDEFTGSSIRVPPLAGGTIDVGEIVVQLSTIFWIGDTSGDWDEPTNWSTGTLPGPTDHVVIDNQAFDITVNFSTGIATVASLRSEEHFALSGGTLTVTGDTRFKGEFEGTGGTLAVSGSDSDLFFSAISSADNVRLELSGGIATDLGELTSFTLGDLVLDGAGTLVDAPSITNVDNARLLVTGGAQLLLSNVETYSTILADFDADVILADDIGSLVSLPGLTTLIGELAVSNPELQRIRARNEGVVNLSAVTSMTGAFDGNDLLHVFAESAGQIILDSLLTIPDGNVFFQASGAGSTIDVSDLTSMTTSFGNSAILVDSGGSFINPNLETTNGTDIEWDGTGSLTLSELTAVTDGALILSGGAVAILPSIVDVDDSILRVSEGAQLTLAGVTSYSSLNAPLDSQIIRADGVGSTINLPAATSITSEISTGGSNFQSVYALNDGTIDLSAVTSITGGLGQNDNLLFVAESGGNIDLSSLVSVPDGNVFFEVNGLGSTIDVTALTSMANDADESGIFVSSDGEFINPNLVELDDTAIEWDGTGTLTLSGLTTIAGGALTLTNGTITSLPNITDVDGATLSVSEGAQLTLAGVTSYSSLNAPLDSQIIRADGVGSMINLPAATSITSEINAGGSNFQSVYALNDGTIDLSAVTSITGGLGQNDNLLFVAESGGNIDLSSLVSVPDGNVFFEVNGLGSTIDVTALTSMANDADESGIFVSSDGEFINPNLVELDDTAIEWDGTGTLTLSGLTTIAGGALTLTNGTITSLPNITDVDGATLSVSEGAQLTLAGVTSYSALTAPLDTRIMQADGTDSSISLPSLTSIVSEIDAMGSNFQSIYALNGGEIDLSAVTSVTGGFDVNDILYFIAESAGTIDLSALLSILDGNVYFQVNGVDSTIDVTAMTSMATSHNNSAIIVDTDGTFTNPNLETLSDTAIEWDGTGTLTLSELTSVTSGAIRLSNGTIATLPDITDIDGSLLSATDGSQLTLAGVTGYDGTDAGDDATFMFAEGTDSQISLTALTSITALASGSGASFQAIYALDSGVIDLSAVEDITGMIQSNDTLFITAENGTSTIMLDVVTEVIDGQVTFTADGMDTLIDVPLLDTYDPLEVMFVELNGGTITNP